MHFIATSDVDVFVFPFGALSFNYNNNIDCYKLVWLSDLFMRILKVPALVCLFPFVYFIGVFSILKCKALVLKTTT